MRPVVFVILAGLLLFSGCKTFEPEPEPSFPLTIPENFSIAGSGSQGVENWWGPLGSEELNALIFGALDQNFDLKTLKAKISQAIARVAKEEAAFFPDLGFSMGGQKKGTQVKKTRDGTTTYTGSHSYDTSLSGSYTADIWGEAAAGKQVQVLSLLSAEADLKGAAQELTAQIAGIWIDIVAARSKKRILDNQIQINQTLLELQKLRFTNGKAKALDVSQQREALAEARSQLPLLEKQEQLLLNSLAFLSGKAAAEQIQVAAQTLPAPVAIPNVGIPLHLLETRPDIKSAKMRLSSSQWAVTAARADLLPSFKISAQALFSSGELDLLFHNWVATLAGSIAGPIFDGGFRRAEVERAKAVAEEQLNLYVKAVAMAIREVEDSLVSIQKQAAYVSLLEEELEVVRLTLEDARVQYQNGQSSYLSYLIAWTSIERLERQLVGERASYIKEWIGLHRALGWKPVQQN